MRRVGIVTVMIAVAALACNMPGVATEPTLLPSQAPFAGIQPSQQPTQSISSSRPAELTPEQIDHITRAAVQIIAAQEQDGTLETMWSGSGTIITPTGEIVTNCHVACGAPILVVSLTTDPGLPPEPTFVAEITHYNEEIDLALLQIKTDMKGNPVNRTDLPYVELGNSDSLALADPIHIFGYPGAGGKTITFARGSVSGFENAEVDGYSQRYIIKTDANITSGNSGGTAVDLYGKLIGIPTSVNTDIREDTILGTIGVLRPANLIAVVQNSPGSPPTAQGAELPPSQEPDANEPNNGYSTATGPVAAGSVIRAYISWEKDIDAYFIQTETAQNISVKLTDIPTGTDYDLSLIDDSVILAESKNPDSEEFIEYSPSRAGTYWIVVYSYKGASITSPYTLAINYDGGEDTIIVTGQAVDANTGTPLSGGQFGILAEGVTCNQFFGAPNLDMNLVMAFTESDARGFFELAGVPRGADYATYFIYGTAFVCENGWLKVPENAIDSDLGIVKMPF
ncbi:MAG: trypsin-like peptidase domain-containing protein [Anaerolineae bacterium]|nr:trypsin-like peptidase domain-containing protein [Anaerolineae bacterium]